MKTSEAPALLFSDVQSTDFFSKELINILPHLHCETAHWEDIINIASYVHRYELWTHQKCLFCLISKSDPSQGSEGTMEKSRNAQLSLLTRGYSSGCSPKVTLLLRTLFILIPTHLAHYSQIPQIFAMRCDCQRNDSRPERRKRWDCSCWWGTKRGSVCFWVLQLSGCFFSWLKLCENAAIHHQTKGLWFKTKFLVLKNKTLH